MITRRLSLKKPTGSENAYLAGKGILLGMSLFFYGYFNFSYLPVIILSILLNYLFNQLIIAGKSAFIRKTWLTAALLVNFSVLFYFKYYDFFLENLNILFRTSFVLKHLMLPLGISFFTFQQVSYIIDSYNNEVPKYNLLDYALFVTFFPQLIAGPIVTHDEIVPQFADDDKKVFNFENFSKGFYALAFGLFKKVIIADTFGKAVEWGYANTDILDSTNAVLLVLFFTIQIYFDFSGYCDMATGIGLMFNIEITTNFNSPYKALTIIDFWKRWHITLTRFFTKYVYIPLGGNRKGKARTYINVMIVFLLSGIWHGSNWTFLLWGAMHGIFSVITRIFQKSFDRFHPAFNWLLTFAFLNVSWVYFRADSVAQASLIIRKILRLTFRPILSEMAVPFRLKEISFLVNNIFGSSFLSSLVHPNTIMTLFCIFSITAVLTMKNTNERIDGFRPSPGRAVLSSFLIVWSVLSFAGVSVFLYFNF